MPPITDRTLILKAKALAQRKQASNDFQYGDVGCALVTQSGRVYLGCSIDTACSMGFCAEHSAIASMLAQGESRVQRIVAVKWNGQSCRPRPLPGIHFPIEPKPAGHRSDFGPPKEGALAVNFAPPLRGLGFASRPYMQLIWRLV